MANKNKERKATRERVARWRAKQKAGSNGVVSSGDAERVTPYVTNVVTDAEIENLPMSLKAQIIAETNTRRVLKLPDNLRGRQEAMVRRFRGF